MELQLVGGSVTVAAGPGDDVVVVAVAAVVAVGGDAAAGATAAASMASLLVSRTGLPLLPSSHGDAMSSTAGAGDDAWA